MTSLHKCILPLMIGCALANQAWAQEGCEEIEGTPPGLYATTDEGRTFLVKDGQVVELGPGESGFADESGVKCIKRPPQFLDWPCATQAAQSRMFATYNMSDLPSKGQLQEIIRRYFSIPEVIAPIPNWIDGEFHGIFDYSDLIQFSSEEYWYFTDTDRPYLDPKRPRSLLVSLYVGINKVVIDRHAIEILRKELGTDQLPVTFVFNDSNVVPISYFGANVSLEEVQKAFFERGIKVADVPQWWLGDYQLKPTIEEFEKFFDLPRLEDISAAKQEEIRQELEAFGFTRKPLIVTTFSDSGAMVVDQPERLRVAASMGIKRFPTSFYFVEPDLVVARCGPGTPIGFGSQSVSGESTPPGGATVNPAGNPGVPPPPPPEPEEPASGS